jgi:Tfp pilus assembly protein PilN
VRELEFLPRWYPSLQRRKSAVAAQAWIALAVVLCMAGAAVAQRWQVHRQEQIALLSSQQIAQSAKQLAKLDELQQQQQQMHSRQDAIAALGANIDMTRLLGAITAAMPPDASLLELAVEVRDGSADQKLKVHLQGVAPSDADVAGLLVNLNTIPFFDRVEMTDVRDRLQGGRVQREFDVSFAVQASAAKGKP